MSGLLAMDWVSGQCRFVFFFFKFENERCSLWVLRVFFLFGGDERDTGTERDAFVEAMECVVVGEGFLEFRWVRLTCDECVVCADLPQRHILLLRGDRTVRTSTSEIVRLSTL